MATAYSIVSLVAGKLSDILLQEAIFLHGVRGEIEWMEQELKRMQSFLEDADAKQQADERVKNWVWDVRDVAYDVEDIIDVFILRIARLRRPGFMGFFKRYALIFKELVACHKVGLEIKHIKIKIGAISESRLTYGIESINCGGGTSSMFQEWRLTSPDVQEPDFVGFEKDIEALVERLTEGEQRRCVVSVVGMGGLGKTTLTKTVYNSDTVKKHFNSQAWIFISQKYVVRDLLQNIINCYMVLSKEELKKVEKMNVAQLRHKISEHLKERRYLMVVDDIWKNEAWDAVKDAFPDVNNGSRIMLTTRNKDVVLYADAQSPPYELRFLNEDESWDLFCKKTFPKQDTSCPLELQKLGREIVGKCQGLPLAIVVIGGLLSRKETREWEKVLKSISWQFVEGQPQIYRILSLSYEDLPHELKPCFLYLGIFPEDYEFPANKLIQLWTAEGLLRQRGHETLEEVGEDLLMELIQRSIIQVAKRNSCGGIKCCRIHDLLRDLSIVKAMEDEFLEVYHGNTNTPA
ncbi:putative disease resistance protein At1g50180 [Magnolia sinica]|uniref:putative disease resistance protein At1g50180 n=1 Tax=Magnolia sinica TaxID=86752 RepID=UPI0026592B98|nr:putative disease resistance protein At1g50180 [Magnolia sinica]